MQTRLKLGDVVAVDVVRKPIKNVHLRVLPPAGRVRISAPERMSLDTVRVFAIAKLPWIKKQQQKLQEHKSRNVTLRANTSTGKVTTCGEGAI